MKIQINPTDVFNIIAAVARLFKDDDFKRQMAETKDALALLLEKLQPVLPRKADGTTWTDAELQDWIQVIRDRESGIITLLGGTGQPA